MPPIGWNVAVRTRRCVLARWAGRVRRCSARTSARTSASAPAHPNQPISTAEFVAALGRTLGRNILLHGIDAPAVVGLSGGIDSVVLTDLLVRALALAPKSASASASASASPPTASRPLLHAVVVDHRVRPESTAEAASVVASIRTRYPPAVVAVHSVRLDMPSDAGDRAGFEHTARQLRYRALGRACAAVAVAASTITPTVPQSVPSPASSSGSSPASSQPPTAYLFTGHHASDQAEEMLMRLARYRPSVFTFQGIPPRSPIPACSGVHGVANSGGTVRFQSNTQDGGTGTGSIPAIPLETGGVVVARPLLSFPKSRIEASAKNLSYVSDRTNHDPTFTLRNTARWLLRDSSTHSHHPLLPEALRPTSLLDLNRSCRRRKAAADDHVRTILTSGIVDSSVFVPALGALVVSFPPGLVDDLNDINNEDNSDIVPALLVRALVSAVSPVPKIETSRLVDPAAALFSTDNSNTRPFTHSGVLFVPHLLASTAGPPPATTATTTTWTLIRSPPSQASTTGTDTTTPIPLDRPRTFVLFDNRFWLAAAISSSPSSSSRTTSHSDAVRDAVAAQLSLTAQFLTRSDIEALYRQSKPATAATRAATTTTAVTTAAATIAGTTFRTAVSGIARALTPPPDRHTRPATPLADAVLRTVPAISLTTTRSGQARQHCVDDVVAIPSLGWTRSGTVSVTIPSTDGSPPLHVRIRVKLHEHRQGLDGQSENEGRDGDGTQVEQDQISTASGTDSTDAADFDLTIEMRYRAVDRAVVP